MVFMARYKKYLVLCLFIFITFLIPFIYMPNVKAQYTHITYSFDNNTFFNETNPSYDLSTNVRNQTIYSGNYTSTYSFKDNEYVVYTKDIHVEGNITYVDDSNGCSDDNTVAIINYDGHNTILNINDTSTSSLQILDNFGSRASGHIQFWIYFNDMHISSGTIIQVYDSVSNCLYIEIDGNELRTYDGGTPSVKVCDFYNDIWYYVELEFDCSTDSFFIYVNGIPYGVYDLWGSPTYLDRIRFQTPSTYLSNFSIDGILYDWIDTLYNNTIPETYQTSITETDKYEFFNNENGTPTYDTQQNIPFWSEITGTPVITKNYDFFNDETAVYWSNFDTSYRGINKTFNINTDNLYQVFISTAKGINYGQEYQYDYYDIYSYDNTLICRLRIDDTAMKGNLSLYRYDGSSYIELQDILNGFWWYTFNITVIKDFIVFILTGYDTDTLEIIDYNIHVFPIITNGKTGLKQIRIYSNLDDTSIAQTGLFIDSVGIYSYNESYSNDWSNYYYETNLSFTPSSFNFLELNATGIFGLSVISFSVSPINYIYFAPMNSSNISFMNICNSTEQTTVNGYLTVSTQTHNYSLDYVYIHGIKLSDSESNTYIPSYQGTWVNWNISYFYVDTLHYLRYTLTTTNNSAIEYIQINFDLIDLESMNKSGAITLFKNRSDLFSEFRINFVDTTYYFVESSINPMTVNNILPQEKIVDSISMLSTDNNASVTKTFTGYFYNFKLIYYVDIGVTISILNFFEIIPIIAVVFLVPIVIGSKTKLKFLIIPLVMVMSIICFTSGLVPLWLMVIINLFCILYYFIKRKYSE